MISIQEIMEKTEEQRKQIERYMDEKGFYYPEVSLYTGQKRSVVRDLKESLRAIPLSEFLGYGSGGAAYLIPTKLHDLLVHEAQEEDLAPILARDVVYGWEGGNLAVTIQAPYGYKARGTKYVQATLTPQSFTAPLIATKENWEDSQFNLLEFNAKEASRGLTRQANDLLLTILRTATDGWGTANSGASGDADETKWTGGATNDIEDAIRGVGNDEWVANTLVATSEALHHSILSTASAAGFNKPGSVKGFDFSVAELDCKVSNSPVLHLSTDGRGAAFTNCVTLVFDRRAALLVGRKRWMQIDNYAKPLDDLVGAVVSCRQGAVTLYDDAIYVLTET